MVKQVSGVSAVGWGVGCPGDSSDTVKRHDGRRLRFRGWSPLSCQTLEGVRRILSVGLCRGGADYLCSPDAFWPGRLAQLELFERSPGGADACGRESNGPFARSCSGWGGHGGHEAYRGIALGVAQSVAYDDFNTGV